MSKPSDISEALRRVLVHPTGGIAGLVDDLLTVCEEHALQLDWQADRCRARSLAGDWQELAGVPLRKSVFRAVLARVAALCNEGSQTPISPYGGQAEITVGTNPATVFRVAFTNTPSDQRLELTRVVPETPGRDGGEPRSNLDARPITPGAEERKRALS